MRADSLEAALPALRRAARALPWRPGPHQQLARVYEALGRGEEARRARRIFVRLYPLQLQVDHHRERVDLDPQDAEARSRLGAAYAAQERFVEAIQEWRKVLRLEPDHPRAAGWIRRAQDKLARLTKGYNPDPGPR
jgi:Flp pilus assembly protein TadD